MAAGVATDSEGNSNTAATQFTITSIERFFSVETFAGIMSSAGSTTGDRLSTRFIDPIDMVYDASGNLYIAEHTGSMIKKMDVNGQITNFVGSSGNTGLVDATGSDARFNYIRGITMDNDGNIIVADQLNHAIRKVTPEGVVTTIAGGTSGFKDGKGSEALFSRPTEVIVDEDNNIYVTDWENSRVRRIDVEGVVTTIAGREVSGYADGDITTATLDRPVDMAFESDGNMIIASRFAIRRLNMTTGELTTIVGGENATTFVDGDKDNAGFDVLNGMFHNENGHMFVVNRHAVRLVTPDGTVSTVAGDPVQGVTNGDPLSARFHFPRGIIRTPEGDFLVADKANHVIRRIKTNIGPTIDISTDESDPTSSSPFEVTFTLSESSANFTGDDVTVGNGTLSNFSGSGTSYTADITPTADGQVTVDVAAGVATDSEGNNNTAADQFSINSDRTSPTVTISSDEPDPSNSNSFQVTFTLSENSTNFTSEDVTVGNGTISNFSGSGTNYTADITPTDDGQITVDVQAGVFTDEAGNGNTAATQFDIISDQTPPTVTITSDESDPTNSATFEVTFTLSESSTDFASGDVTVGNGTLSNFAGSGTSYTADITPSADGQVTVDVAEGVAVTDNAGNGNSAATQFSITSDQTPPTVTITSDEVDPSNSASIEVTFTLSESSSDFTSEDITAGNGTISNFSGSGTTYTADITPTADGEVTVDVAAGVATDAAGNANTAAEQFSITSDQTPPTVTITSEESDPSNSATFEVTFTLSESSTDFAGGDVTIGNGTLSNFTGSGTNYTADITPAADGQVTIDVAAGVSSDAAGNTNTAAGQFSITSDQTKPTVTLATDSNTPTNGSFVVTATFSEPVEGFELSDITITDGVASEFSATDASTYSFSVTSTNNTANVDVAEGVAADAASNTNTAATQLNLVFNHDPTDISLTSTSIAENSGADATVGTLSTVDEDETDTHTYALVAGTGDTDNGSFTVTDDQLIAKEDFDFETKNTYSIRVKTTDSFGSSFEKEISITVTNVPEAILRISGEPTIANTPLGHTTTFEITAHNDGDGELVISSINYPEGFSGPNGATVDPSGSEVLTLSFTPLEQKTYSGDITITSNGGEETFAVSAIGEIVTDLDDSIHGSDFITIYPNPASDLLTIDFSKYTQKPLDVSLYDLSGIRRFSKTRQQQPIFTINVSNYSEGLYLVYFTDGESVVYKKVLIKR